MGRLYVGNLPFSITEEQIAEFFSGHAVGNIKIVIDRETNKPRGFAFVDSEGDLGEIITATDGQELGGREIRVSEARDKGTDRPRAGGTGRSRRGADERY